MAGHRDSTHRRLGPLIPFGACFVVVWGMIGLEHSVRWGEVLAALVLQLLVAAALWWRERWEQSQVASLYGVAVFLASVALLRAGVGRVVGGYGTLVLLPVIWAALRNRRLELVFAVAGAAARAARTAGDRPRFVLPDLGMARRRAVDRHRRRPRYDRARARRTRAYERATAPPARGELERLGHPRLPRWGHPVCLPGIDRAARLRPGRARGQGDRGVDSPRGQSRAGRASGPHRRRAARGHEARSDAPSGRTLVVARGDRPADPRRRGRRRRAPIRVPRRDRARPARGGATRAVPPGHARRVRRRSVDGVRRGRRAARAAVRRDRWRGGALRQRRRRRCRPGSKSSASGRCPAPTRPAARST